MFQKKSYSVLLRSKEKVRTLTSMDGAYDFKYQFLIEEVLAFNNKLAIKLARFIAKENKMTLVRVAKLKNIYVNKDCLEKVK